MRRLDSVANSLATAGALGVLGGAVGTIGFGMEAHLLPSPLAARWIGPP
jgi:hypothetical protein